MVPDHESPAALPEVGKGHLGGTRLAAGRLFLFYFYRYIFFSSQVSQESRGAEKEKEGAFRSISPPLNVVVFGAAQQKR